MSNTCISHPYNDSLRNYFYLSQPEQIIIYVISPFIYLTAIFNIRFFLKGKRKAQPPADILLFICIFGTFRITSYIASSIYAQIYPPLIDSSVPSNFDSFCTGTGFINIMCEIASFVYNVVFCIYYVVKIRNPLKSWIKQHRQLHIFCLFLILIGTLIFYLTNLIGIDILGICAFKIGEGIIFLEFALTLSYFIVMVVCSIFFLNYLRSVSKVDNDTRIYFKFYFKFLIISSIANLIGILALMIVTIKCLLDSSDQIFQIFAIICNLTKLISPVIVFFIMLGHPQAKFSLILRQINSVCFKKKFISQTEQQMMEFYSQFNSTNRTSMMVQLKTFNSKNLQNGEDFLSKIKDKNKACLINTILGCLSLQQTDQIDRKFDRTSLMIQSNHSIRINDLNFLQMQNQQLYSWNFYQRSEFQLNQQVLSQYRDVFLENLPPLDIKFIAFNFSVFKQIQKNNKIYNLDEKLTPIKNSEKILKQVQTDGGRSGQFFFFNYDNSLIIKTISNNQLQVLISRIQAYYYYFQTNINSLIVKIYGVYKIINQKTEQQFSFMLMGNILKSINRKYVIRSYDMKGSKYQRQVLSKQQYSKQNQIKTQKTLKDVDFQNLEGQLYISREDSNQLKKSIQQDTIFLYSQGLIDYSLIVIKINYALYLQQNQDAIKDLNLYKSTKQQGVYYILGIIDYLQTWNMRKKGQKWYKSIFNKKDSISSQDPRFYAQRFMKNLINVILP